MSPKVDGRADFDFLYGAWQIRNRRLRSVFQRNPEWQEFDATVEVEPVLGGVGHIEKFEAVMPDGYALDGLTLRIFNPETGLWSMHWSDTRVYSLIPPVVGRFENGSGQFHGTYRANGMDVRILFTWSDITPTTAAWSQSFSIDDGQTWERNWEMEFTRIAA
ncbi:MAG: hypothetical protein KF883_09755 [Thermomicrobiales bacterium]|nr:hypothetical protein [Thermomicrobiales bacterium]